MQRAFFGRWRQTGFVQHALEAFASALCRAGILTGNVAPDVFFFFIDKFLLGLVFCQPSFVAFLALIHVGAVITAILFKSWGHLTDHIDDLVKKITALFLIDMPGQIRKLEKHIADGDIKAAGDQAHQIKGAAANLGGMAFSASAQAVDQAARAGVGPEKVSALLSELERQFQVLKECLPGE